MPELDLTRARQLGKGTMTEQGIADLALASRLSSYKARIAGAYRSTLPEDIASLPLGGWASPKIDGELWFLCLDGSTTWLANPHGTVISGDVPLLNEAKLVASRLKGRLLVAGELHVRVDGRRCRVGDLGAALGGAGKAEVDRLCFAAFDILSEDAQQVGYSDRLLRLRDVITGSERLRVAETYDIATADDVQKLYDDHVVSGVAEGLVIRARDGMVYKVKPSQTIVAAILGFTIKADATDSVRSILLGLIHEDNTTQILGACGNLGSDDDRKALLARLKPLSATSHFRYASDSGGLYTFIKPEVVAEIKVTDLQAEKSDGTQLTSMALRFDGEVWIPLRPMPSVSPLHPVLVRVRDGKKADAVDVSFAQVVNWLACKHELIPVVEVPKSSLLRREVWTKEAKGKIAVRKLLVWKTNKGNVDSSFPGYVVHWTDYSAGRGTPLDREVRLAMEESVAMQIADKLIADNIKKGWDKVS
jgi:hypothetical protein